MAWRIALAGVAVLAFCLVTPATAQFMDDFEDGDFGDANWTDPCNPYWGFLHSYGDAWYEAVIDGELYLWSSAALAFYSANAAWADDGGTDPNTSMTWFKDDTSHYILAKVHCWPNYGDPNLHRSATSIALHLDPIYETTLWVTYEFSDGDPPSQWEGAYFAIQGQNGYDTIAFQRIFLEGYGGLYYDDPNDFPGGDPNSHPYNPADPNWRNFDPNRTQGDPNNYWASPGFMDEINGFWLLFQFQVDDANYPCQDPNGKSVKTAAWNGDKTDWDGTYLIDIDLGWPNSFRHYLSHPEEWEGRWPEWWDGSVADMSQGICGLLSYGGMGVNGLPAEAFYDDVEVGDGVFAPTPKRIIQMSTYHGENGTVSSTPAGKKWYDWIPGDWEYIEGTAVTLTALPNSGKIFLKWKYNELGGATIEDTNTTLDLLMDRDWQVEAQFKCGSSVPPFLAMTLLAFGVAVVVRRRLL